MTRVIILISLGIVSCIKDTIDPVEVNEVSNTANLRIKLEHVFNGEPLNYDSNYVTPNGDKVRFSRFKYYLSNMIFLSSEGDQVLENHYDLIELSNDTNIMFLEKEGLAEGHYSSIKLSVGVDESSNNISLDSKGDLDPTGVDGMNDSGSGYQFVNIKGTYDSNGVTGDFTYEIGGNDNYKIFHFLGVDDHTHDARSGGEGTLHVDLINDQITTVHFVVDLAELFVSPNVIDVKKDIATSTSFMNNIHTSHVEGKTGWFQLHHNETE